MQNAIDSEAMLHARRSPLTIVLDGGKCKDGKSEDDPANDGVAGVMDPSMTLACKVGLGLQELQKRGRRILAVKKAKEAKENMWIGWMVAAESIEGLNRLIRSRAT